MVNEPKPPAVVNASAYAVWRALSKYELVEWKNAFLKMHIAVRCVMAFFAALSVLGSVCIALIALFMPNILPDELLDVESASGISAIVFVGLFYFLFMMLSNPQFTPSLGKTQILSPLPVPLSSRYAHRISAIFLSFITLYFMALPAFSFICAAYEANLLQAAAYAVGWISLYLFAIGICVGGATLLSRWFGAERSAKAFQVIFIAMLAGFGAVMFYADKAVDSIAGAVEIGKRLLPALPSTWTVYILEDSLLALAALPALLIVGAAGLLLGYAAFARAFDMEAELISLEKKESGKRKASSRRRSVFASLLVKDYKIFVHNRKTLGGWIFSLGIWGVYLSFSLLSSTSAEMVGTIANAYAIAGAFSIGLALPSLEGRAVLSVRMAMPNLRMYAVSKASFISFLIFVYALIGLAIKQKAFPAAPDAAAAALIAVGHGCFCVGIAFAFPRFDVKGGIGCAALICLGLFFAATAIAFGAAPAAAHIWLAAVVCASGVVMANAGRKRLERADL